MTKERNKLNSKSATVLKLIAEGRTYQQVLDMHPELTYLDIFRAAREALEVTGELPTAYEERLARIRKDYPRAYEQWTDQEDAELAQLVRSGCSPEEIAARLQRQPSAIRSRMLKRNLVGGEATVW